MNNLEKLIDAATRGDLPALKTVLQNHPELINQCDSSGATAIHYAAFGGHRSIVEELVKQGADINAQDGKFGATPTGWAIEYLREMGGFLGIELADFAHAIQRGDVEWVKRFLTRFPALREASGAQGKPFKQLAKESGNQEIANLFGTTLI